jgi:hypothetical protein
MREAARSARTPGCSARVAQEPQQGLPIVAYAEQVHDVFVLVLNAGVAAQGAWLEAVPVETEAESPGAT